MYSAAPARHEAFGSVTPALLQQFASVLSVPQSSLLTTIPSETKAWNAVQPSELDGFNKDWMGKYMGHSACVVRPKSTEEVSNVMRICYENNIAVVPQGGNTGLVGGGVPVHDEVVLNLSSMNKIRSFDAVSGTLVCDAGAILEALDNEVAQHGYMMPLDLGAKGSCHIGGNVATNAGGLRFLRYGSLHGTVLGLEVVLSDGRVLPGLRTLRKDNTGLDLKQLFIGSEGSLGIITGVAIATPRRPNANNVAVFGVESFEAVQKTFQLVRTHCSEILSAFEFLDHQSFDVVLSHSSMNLRDPFESRHPMYVLIETSGSNKEHDDAKLQALLEDLLESDVITDGVLAQDETQVKALWSLREGVPEALGHYGKVYKYDISMPIEKMYELVETLRNLHINIVAEAYDAEIEAAIEPFIYEWIQNVDGSISAEHGLGLMKAEKIGFSKDALSIQYMKDIKRLFDPKGILNPYKYLPPGQGFLIGITSGLAGGYLLQRRYAHIRNLTTTMKTFLVASCGTGVGVIFADRAGIQFDETDRKTHDQEKLRSVQRDQVPSQPAK
ncbi:(R)-2-hydroxyglutarate--pyruvate transhydrogenase [Malassezia caprae]|uniref:(R)-2-hydroxyglutarate--pyruvate transhydrogenase n=1 Tax=Malassezia caprae TaxID=1381934 RepID=A0AAF0IWP9_9BASI|nr:(R)-2-hydroxyglutarate--pyruvate transhydrogenase [Malassezia caprae]